MLGKTKDVGKATKCTRLFSVVMVVAMVLSGFLGIVSTTDWISGSAKASGTTTLFSDDFNDGNYDGWEIPYGGDYGVTVENQRLKLCSGECVCAVNGDYAWTDYILEADIDLPGYSCWDDQGLAFRIVSIDGGYWGAPTGYFFGLSYGGETASLRKGWLSGSTPITSETVNVGTGTHHLIVMVAGTNIQCYIDGEKIFDVYDSTYTSGKIGVYGVGPEGTVYFDNIVVTAGSDDVGFRPLQEEGVITSPVGPVAWNYEMGYRFTPNVKGYVTQLGFYGTGDGDTKTCNLWTDSGSKLASVSVTDSEAGFSYAPINPVSVSAGTYYRVSVSVASANGYYQSYSTPRTIGNIYIASTCYYYPSGSFPSYTYNYYMYGIADMTLDVERPLQDEGEITSPNCYSWDYEAGYRFKPNVNGYVTQLGFWGTGDGDTKTCHLWSDDGTLIASVDVSDSGAGFSYASITPVSVSAGTYYRVSVPTSGPNGIEFYSQSYSTPRTIGNIYIASTCYGSGSGNFPSTIGSSSYMYGIADMTFIPNQAPTASFTYSFDTGGGTTITCDFETGFDGFYKVSGGDYVRSTDWAKTGSYSLYAGCGTDSLWKKDLGGDYTTISYSIKYVYSRAEMFFYDSAGNPVGKFGTWYDNNDAFYWDADHSRSGGAAEYSVFTATQNSVYDITITLADSQATITVNGASYGPYPASGSSFSTIGIGLYNYGNGKAYYDDIVVEGSGGGSSLPLVGSPIQFDATTSSDIDGVIVKYEWDWTNDGIYDDVGQLCPHTYTSSGTYTVKLRVTDDDGATAETTQSVRVNAPPTACFTTNAHHDNGDWVYAGNSITFTSTSSDIDGTISSYEWDFGDGTTGTGATVSHFSTAAIGTYLVQLTVTDNDGAKDVYTMPVGVASALDFTLVRYDGPYAYKSTSSTAVPDWNLPESGGLVALGDLDNDGDLDALASYHSSGGDKVIHAYENMGTPDNYPCWLRRESWDPIIGWSDSNSLTSFSLGDWDNDGDLDLALGRTYNDKPSYYWYHTGYAMFYENCGSKEHPDFYGGNYKQKIDVFPRISSYNNPLHGPFVYLEDANNDGNMDVLVGYYCPCWGHQRVTYTSEFPHDPNFVAASVSGWPGHVYDRITTSPDESFGSTNCMFSVPAVGVVHSISTQQEYVNDAWTHDPIVGDNINLGASKQEDGVDEVIPGNPWSVDFSVSPSFTYSLGNEVLYQSSVTGGYDKYGNLEGTANVDIKTTSDTSFTFTPSMSVYADYDNSLRLAKFTVGGSVDTTIGVDATVNVAGHYGYERKLYEYHQFFYQQAGIVPVWEELVIEVYGGFDIDASATGTVTAKAYISGGVTLGGEYERGVGWTGITDTSFDAYGDVTWSINGNVAVTPYISVRPTVYIYSVVGPQFDIRPYVELKGEHSQTGDTVYDSWTLSGGVKSTLNFDLRAYGEILSNDINLFDFRTVVAGESTYTFTGQTTDPRTIHYFTVESGVSSITVQFEDNGYTSEWMRCRNPDEQVLEEYTAGTYSVPADKLEAGTWCIWVNEDATGGYNLGHTYKLTVTVNY